MKYRTLGSTGIEVSVVGVGTWQFGGEWGHDYTESEASDILAAAKDTGINLIDTAECYGDHLSEELVGKTIQGDRQQWIVATKFGHKFHTFMNRTEAWSPSAVITQLEDSLRALKTDYIDIYQFHSGTDDKFETPGLWTALQKQVELGKIRHLGISIGNNTNSKQTKAAPSLNAEVIQVVYNRLDRGPEAEVLPACGELNLGVLARVPLASGFLSGKYQPGARFAENDVRAGRDRADIDKRLKQVEDIKTSEVPEGVPMASWALAWCLKSPTVTAVIPGCKSPEQVFANARASDLL